MGGSQSSANTRTVEVDESGNPILTGNVHRRLQGLPESQEKDVQQGVPEGISVFQHSENHKIKAEEFARAVEEVEAKFIKQTGSPVCQDLQQEVYNCYQEHYKESLRAETITGRNVKEAETITGRNVKEAETITGRNVKEAETITGRNVKGAETITGRNGRNYNRQKCEGAETITGRNVKGAETITGRNVKEAETITGRNVKEAETITGRNVKEAETITGRNVKGQKL
ncbi:LOW QUALITY PROTEIN: MIC19-like protein [Mya arenaria]|uniref:MIC19-like protein n=1 Tax=Mya arenaria TaxID=6604 RepID=A0ABY7FX32_MYAAR|nr:LOW QUALITY PROTEIN: MIC19-like protein [Mya arenaria]